MDLLTVESWVVPTERADLAVLADPAAAPLAGGTWMFADRQVHLRTLVDLTALGWEPVVPLGDGGVELAATCTIAALVTAAGEHAGEWPALADLAPRCAHALASSPKVWDHATVGGNVCVGLPAGAMTTLLVALDAVATVWRPDGTSYDLAVVDLVTGNATTALGAGEVVRRFTLAPGPLRARTSFQRVSLAPQGRTGAVLVARRDADGAVVVSLTGGTERPHRLAYGAPAPDRATDRATDLARDLDALTDWLEDHHGTPAWRRAMTLRMGGAALDELAGTP